MWESILNTLWQQAFWLGAAIVMAFHAPKFSQLNLADPVISRYVGLLPGATVRDFASKHAYHISLFAFLAVSLVGYFSLCQVSPDVLKGALTVLNVTLPPGLDSVPYQLLVAGLFVGFTTPLPFLSWVGNAQRNFFHDRIEVPKRVIDFSQALTTIIIGRCGTDKRRLAYEVRTLAGRDFVMALQSYGDVAYYKLQIEKLDIGDGVALDRAIRESSPRELRAFIERLVLCALVAAMRRSGSNSLAKVAQSLDASVSPLPTGNVDHFATSFTCSAVVLAIVLVLLACLFWMLAGPVAMLFPGQKMWPNSFENAALELYYIVPPIFISLLLAVFFAVLPDRTQSHDFGSHQTSLAEFVGFFRSNIVVLVMCIGITVLINLCQMLYEYGTTGLPQDARKPLRLLLPTIQGFIPVAVCLFTTWYLVSSNSRPPVRGLSFKATLLAIAVTTGVVGLCYELIFVSQYVSVHKDLAPGHDHILFGVLANVLVSISAFGSIALFFTVRDRLPERTRIAHRDHPETMPKNDGHPNEVRRPPRKARRVMGPNVGANGHMSPPGN